MSLNAVTYSRMLRLLVDGEYTRHELAKETGLHTETTCRYVKEMHKRKLVYVCGWKRNRVNGNWAPVYTFSVEETADASKPPIQGRQINERNYRAKLKERKLLHMMAGRIGD